MAKVQWGPITYALLIASYALLVMYLPSRFTMLSPSHNHVSSCIQSMKTSRMSRADIHFPDQRGSEVFRSRLHAKITLHPSKHVAALRRAETENRVPASMHPQFVRFVSTCCPGLLTQSYVVRANLLNWYTILEISTFCLLHMKVS